MTSIAFLAGCLAAMLVGVCWMAALSMVRSGLAARTLHRLAGIAFWTTAVLPLTSPWLASLVGASRGQVWWPVVEKLVPGALPAQVWLIDAARVGVAMLAATGLLAVTRLARRIRHIRTATATLRGALARGGAAVAADVPGPVLMGYRKPVVVLPARSMTLPAQVVDALVRHELAHARRHDNWRLFAEHLARAALPWCRPLVAIHDVMLSAREELCDADALASVDEATREGYARALVDILRRTSVAPVGMSAMAGHLPALQRRLSAIIDPSFASPPLSRRRAVAAIATMAIALSATWGMGHLGSGVEAIAGEYGMSVRFVAEAGGERGVYRMTTIGGEPEAGTGSDRQGATYRVGFTQDRAGTWQVTTTPIGTR